MKIQYLFAAALALPAFAGSFSYTTVTTGQSTFNRPIENGNAAPTTLSVIGTAVPYSAQSFTVSASGSYTFTSNSILPVNWDNYLILYSNNFNPLNPLNNAVIANNDNPFVGTSGFSTGLTAGTTYILVTTGFMNTSAGSAQNTVVGLGNIVATPEPLSASMIGLGLLVFGILRRKKSPAT